MKMTHCDNCGKLVRHGALSCDLCDRIELCAACTIENPEGDSMCRRCFREMAALAKTKWGGKP